MSEVVIVKDEAFWHRKHPLIEQQYNGRPCPDGKIRQMYVRDFLSPYSATLQKVLESLDISFPIDPLVMDTCALKLQQYVVKYLTYTPDEKLGRNEYWLFPIETHLMGRGDCEDGGLYLASLLYNAFPVTEHWRIRVAAGWVKPSPTAPSGGHAYVVYCRPQDNEWVVLDWCFFQDSSILVADKKPAKLRSEYADVWFSFWYKYAYAHRDFNISGRINKHEMHL